jgi:hypothetical protein
MSAVRLQTLFCLSFLALAACASDDSKDDETGETGETGETSDTDEAQDTGDAGGADAVCEDPEPVVCEDDIILDLSLQDDKISDGEVSNETDGDDFITYVDATAGGYSAASSNPWVYFRFTDSGAERVDIDDVTALQSMDWDMSMRRYLVRINGGTSGPSCVGAVPLLEADYADVEALPDDSPWVEDGFYTDDCTFVTDTSGLPNSPQVAMGQWWEYPGCVATTMTPHVIRLASGRQLKIVIEAYYGEGQENCNDRGAMGSDSANMTIRWAFLN